MLFRFYLYPFFRAFYNIFFVSYRILCFFQLCCFFLPKVYAVICKPDKRQRKPQTSRMRKYETPPHSVAVGFADGALLGDVSRYNIQNIFSMSSAAALSTDLSYPQMSNLQSFGDFGNVSKIKFYRKNLRRHLFNL